MFGSKHPQLEKKKGIKDESNKDKKNHGRKCTNWWTK